jgi:cytochrome c556
MLKAKVLTGCAMLAGVAVIASGIAVAQDAIANRRAMMKAIGGAMKQSVQMVKGEAPFDPAKAKANMDVMADWHGFSRHFPKGSETGGETTAAPKIWQQFEDFDARGRKMAADAARTAAAAGEGIEAFKASFGDVARSCKNCHQDYRTK